MHTRPVRADELDLFVEAAGSPDHGREVEQHLKSMFAAGSMRPEWWEVSEGTLDREIQGEREMLGPQRAAHEFFEDAQRVKYDPAWWRLAYAPNGELVGLVMPAEW